MRIIAIVAVVVLSSILPVEALAEAYLSAGGGAGGEADAPNVTLEFGGVLTRTERDHLFAVGLGFIFNAGDVPSGTLGYPVPHNDYTNLGKRQEGNELVVIGKYGLEVIKDKRVFIFALGGFSNSDEIELARSNVTGWYYEQSSSPKYHGVFGGGLSYFPINKRISLSVEYDNRRGVTGGIGYRF